MNGPFNQLNQLNHHHQPSKQHPHKAFNGQRKRYSCDQCSYSTDRRDLFRRHENIHKDEKPFRCYICNKMFNRADHVKKHFLRIHKGFDYNVKLIKRSNGADYSLPPTVDPNQNGENCNMNGGNSIDKVDSNDFDEPMDINYSSKSDGIPTPNGYQIVFPKFTSPTSSPSPLPINPQPQRSLLSPIKQQQHHQQQQPQHQLSRNLQSASPNQRSLLKQPNPPSSSPPRSLLTLLQHQQQHPLPPPPPPSSSALPPTFSSSSSSSLSSPTPPSPTTYNTNSDSDDDTTITTINHNNQIIIVICGNRNSNQKSIINHMINNNGLKRYGKYLTQTFNRTSSSPSSIGSTTRKDKRKQTKPKRASSSPFSSTTTLESPEVEIC